jgi:ArsR family transcriptional regulator
MPRQIAAFIKALADETRLRIIALLDDEPLHVLALADALAVPQPRISRHLAYLARVKLVAWERRGRFVYYRLAPPGDRDPRMILNALGHWVALHPSTHSDRARLRRILRS